MTKLNVFMTYTNIDDTSIYCLHNYTIYQVVKKRHSYSDRNSIDITDISFDSSKGLYFAVTLLAFAD